MCGIFGYYNYKVTRDRKAILEFLFTGLRRLEYRGYDSAGISIDSDVSSQSTAAVPNGSATGTNVASGKAHKGAIVVEDGSSTYTCTPIVIKSSGKIDALVDQAYTELKSSDVNLHTNFDSHAGIAHTRWATHGQPTTTNCHPHVSDDKHEFVVVHNGIITNYKPLKDFLVGQLACLCVANFALQPLHLLMSTIFPAYRSSRRWFLSLRQTLRSFQSYACTCTTTLQNLWPSVR